MIEDPNLEKDFLAALADLSDYDLDDARALIESSSIVESDFSRADHWLLYRSIAACVQAKVPAHADAIIREARKITPDRAVVVASILDGHQMIGAASEGLRDQLLELSDRRRTAKLLEDASKRIAYGSEDPAKIRFKLGNALQHTRGRRHSKGLDEYVNEVESHLKAVRDGTAPPVIPWYIPRLDAAIGGVQPTLILVGAEPGVGKSALIASAVNLQARHGHKPFVASLEDSPSWLAYRVVSNDSQKNQFDLRFAKMGHYEFEELVKKNETMKEQRSRIRVVDGSETGMKIEDLVSSINDAIVNEGCDSVWIDHLGEILLTSSERTDLEISRHLSLLRGIANRHGIPVVVAAHFKRPDDPMKPPSFRDFANSSGSERKARVALGLRRNPGSDILSVHVMKQTNGPAGQCVDLMFAGAAAMIADTEGGINR